jgi:hypothetical protein
VSVRPRPSVPDFNEIQNGKKYVLQQEEKHDKLDLVASAEKKTNVL